MFSPVSRSERPELVTRETEVIRRHDPAHLAEAMLVPLSYRSIEQRLGDLTTPTLVLWGEDDTFAPLAQAELYRQRLRYGEVQIVPGAGHCLPLECPAAVTDALKRFLPVE